MASRYWVGGGSSTNWSATSNTNWAATSGGSNNQSVPGSSDDVFFDSVGVNASGTSNVDANFTLVSLNFAPATGSFTGTLTGSNNITISKTSAGGDLKFSSGMTCSYSGLFTFLGAATHALTSNGNTTLVCPFKVQGTTSVVQQQDALVTTGAVTLTGTTGGNTMEWQTNGNNLTCASITPTGAGTKKLTCSGSEIITLTGTGTVFTSVTTFTAASSTIKITDSSATGKTFAGGGAAYNNLWISMSAGTATVTLTGANTFANIKDDGTGAHTIILPASTTTTATSLTSPNAGVITLNSSSAGTAATLSIASGDVAVTGWTIKDSTVSGGARFTAWLSTNVSGNTGWTFMPMLLHGATAPQAIVRASTW